MSRHNKATESSYMAHNGPRWKPGYNLRPKASFTLH